MTRKKPPVPRIALALAGGGPLGAIYEIGALCALDEALAGIDLRRLDHYIGVSAGSFIAASLANGMSPRELCAAFIENSEPSSDVFDPSWMLVPAYGEYLRRAIMLPGLAATTLWNLALGRKPFVNSMERLARVLPTGIFSNEEVHRRLAQAFTRDGRTNDFRRLETKLTIVATDLDSGEPAPFGRPGFDNVPISRAVQASSALPGLFPPVEIGEHSYVDGALKKTLHATVALDDGVDLLLCLNPLVPFDVPRIVDGGLPAVLSQTFRSMIHSRMELGMRHYEHVYRGTDIVLFEPDQRDSTLFMANTFSYSERRALAEHAYQQTREALRARKAHLTQTFARHSIVLRSDVLAQDRRLVDIPPRSRLQGTVASLNRTMDELERLLPRTA